MAHSRVLGLAYVSICRRLDIILVCLVGAGIVWLDIEKTEILWSFWVGVIGCVAVFSAQGVKAENQGSVVWFAVAVLLQVLWIGSELVLQTPLDKVSAGMLICLVVM